MEEVRKHVDAAGECHLEVPALRLLLLRGVDEAFGGAADLVGVVYLDLAARQIDGEMTRLLDERAARARRDDHNVKLRRETRPDGSVDLVNPYAAPSPARSHTRAHGLQITSRVDDEGSFAMQRTVRVRIDAE